MPSSTQIRPLEASDQPLLESFLAPRIDSSIFLLNNSRRAGLVDRGQPLEGTYLAAFVNRRVVGVAALYWNGNVVLQAPAGLTELIRALGELRLRPLAGLLGPNRQVVEAMTLLGITENELAIDGPEGLYSLDLQYLHVPTQLSDRRWLGRPMTTDDLPREIAWRLAYSLETLGKDDSPELRRKCRQDLERSLANSQTWVLEDGRKAVATSSFNAVLSEVVQVGGVYTPPSLRGKGYGRAAVAASLRDSHAVGVPRAVLFTEDSNHAARRAYNALGFERIGDYRVALLRRPWHPAKS